MKKSAALQGQSGPAFDPWLSCGKDILIVGSGVIMLLMLIAEFYDHWTGFLTWLHLLAFSWWSNIIGTIALSAASLCCTCVEAKVWDAKLKVPNRSRIAGLAIGSASAVVALLLASASCYTDGGTDRATEQLGGFFMWSSCVVAVFGIGVSVIVAVMVRDSWKQ